MKKITGKLGAKASLSVALMLAFNGGTSASLIGNVAGVVSVPHAASAFISTDNAFDRALSRAESLSWDRFGNNGLWVDTSASFDWGNHLEAGDYKTGFKGKSWGASIGYEHIFRNAGVTIGVAASFDNGKFESKDSRFNESDKYKSYGTQLYAGWRAAKNLNLVGGIGFFENKGDISVTGLTGKPKPKTELYTAAVKAEFPISASVHGMVIPYIGARYTQAKTKNLDLNAGVAQLSASFKDARVVDIPVGVGLREDFLFGSGWTVTPRLDVAVIPRMGDTKQKITVGLAQGGTAENVSAQFSGRFAYQLKASVKAQKKNWALGAHYGFTGGDKGRVGVGLMLTAEVKF